MKKKKLFEKPDLDDDAQQVLKQYKEGDLQGYEEDSESLYNKLVQLVRTLRGLGKKKK